MKIRILGNSIRFRLNKSEVAELCTNGKVSQRTVFKDTVFYYSVEVSTDHASLTAEFDGRGIKLYLPGDLAKHWDEDERVGFQDSVKVREGEELALLLEKDFTCLVPRGEDEPENYPNPKSSH